MKISSPDFHNDQRIPMPYTCEGANINPTLEFSNIPSETKSLTLIVDDPDVPAQVRKEKMYDHWVVFNIPPTTIRIEANQKPQGIEGVNTSGEYGYTGPCPPRQFAPTEHRYHFKLYALDTTLSLPAGATKTQVEQAMQGHILAEAKLIGRYEKVSRE